MGLLVKKNATFMDFMCNSFWPNSIMIVILKTHFTRQILATCEKNPCVNGHQKFTQTNRPRHPPAPSALRTSWCHARRCPWHHRPPRLPNQNVRLKHPAPSHRCPVPQCGQARNGLNFHTFWCKGDLFEKVYRYGPDMGLWFLGLLYMYDIL